VNRFTFNDHFTMFSMQPFCKLMGFVALLETFSVQVFDELSLGTHMIITDDGRSLGHVARHLAVFHG